MHIPDAYLSPATEAAGFAVMAPVWAVAMRRTSRELTSRQAPLLSIGAAFCFAIQMFNVPAVGGTTAHALGAVLLAILVGRWAAVLGMTLTLAIQALLFGDGGILSFGVNCFNMGFVAVFVCFGVYRLVAGKSDLGTTRGLVGAATGAYVGTAAASLSAGLLLGIQPLVAHDALGRPLYCPFGLGVTLPAMLTSHLLAAAPVEGMITVAALAYLWRSFPELLRNTERPKTGATLRLARRFGWVLVLTPLGLIAGGSAFAEWDPGELRAMVGFVPQGMAKAHELIHPLLPDYGFGSDGSRPIEIAGYLVSALVGSSALALFTWGLLRSRRRATPEVLAAPPAPDRQATGELPAWLLSVEPTLPAAKPVRAPWLERTMLRMRSTVARTIASEEVARSSGFLQSLQPTPKGIGFLCALIATSLAGSPWLLGGMLAATLLAAAFSAVPLKSLAARVGGSVAFFGLVIAVPLSLQAVTKGPAAFQLLGIAFSKPGLALAATMLLRLATGISLALIWNWTTPWYRLIRSLGSLGVPRSILGTATLTYRYLFVMMETLADMVEARTSRQVGACDKRQAREYAGAGTAVLFAKSLALAEETHLAMRARAFDHTPAKTGVKRWRLADLAVASGGLTLLMAVVFQGGFHVV